MNRRLLRTLALAWMLLGTAAGSSAVGARTAGEAKDWILLTSNRDGTARPYSVASDGSRLSPLLPSDRPLEPAAVSPDRRLVAYGPVEGPGGPIYVSRADGSGLRRLVRKGLFWTFSPNGRQIAYTRRGGIWIVRTNGHGLRRVTARGDAPAWSPNGKALVFIRVIDAKNERFAVVERPLRGKERVLARTGPSSDAFPDEFQAEWSPDGRWISYINYEDAERRNGLTLVRPNGKNRHRVVIGAGEEDTYVWSPSGRFLVYEDGIELDVIRPDGNWRRLSAHAQSLPVWSPDGKKLAFPVFPQDLAVARGDGRGRGGWASA